MNPIPYKIKRNKLSLQIKNLDLIKLKLIINKNNHCTLSISILKYRNFQFCSRNTKYKESEKKPFFFHGLPCINGKRGQFFLIATDPKESKIICYCTFSASHKERLITLIKRNQNVVVTALEKDVSFTSHFSFFVFQWCSMSKTRVQ